MSVDVLFQNNKVLEVVLIEICQKCWNDEVVLNEFLFYFNLFIFCEGIWLDLGYMGYLGGSEMYGSIHRKEHW